VAYGWRQEHLAANAQKISETGKELYARMAKLSDHFGKVGKNLDRAVGSYNDAVASLEGRVLPQARRFKDLQASTGDEIPTLEPISTKSRGLAAPELTAPSGMDDTGTCA
jgi:DNA recombination protein RmuC